MEIKVQMKKWLMISMSLLLISQASIAQSSTTSVRRNVATIMFTGLAGAVLGLSTLSFYGEPQEHVGNIWTGLAVGVLAGSAYVLSRNSGPSYENVLLPTNPHQMKNPKPALFAYTWDF